MYLKKCTKPFIHYDRDLKLFHEKKLSCRLEFNHFNYLVLNLLKSIFFLGTKSFS